MVFCLCAAKAPTHMSLLEKIKHELVNSSALLNDTKQKMRDRIFEMTASFSDVHGHGMAGDESSGRTIILSSVMTTTLMECFKCITIATLMT